MMYVNIIYEDSGRIDLADIPESLISDLEAIQACFFKWLFNKSIDHPYWVFTDGKKAYCNYDAEAFIVWINQIYFNGKKNAAVIEKFRKSFLPGVPKIVF